ncbi:hypothetical protein RKD44_007691 [Streptomyces collinus]
MRARGLSLSGALIRMLIGKGGLAGRLGADYGRTGYAGCADPHVEAFEVTGERTDRLY